VGVWLFNGNATCDGTVATKTNNTVKFNTISNGAVTNTTGIARSVDTRRASLTWVTRT
jgi:hypothetical protein